MFLAFEFSCFSSNGVLENLLEDIAKESKIVHKILRKKEIVTLYVEADEEGLGLFADKLSMSLPLSIFYKPTGVSVVDSMPKDEQVIPKMDNEVLFTPKKLATFEFECADLVDKIMAGLCVEINGCNIGKIESLPSLVDDFEVVATDLSVVQKMVLAQENELYALATLERPSIRFRVNAVYESKAILPANRVVLRLADSLELFCVCLALFEKGVEFLYMTNNDKKASLQISVLENNEIFVVNGQSPVLGAIDKVDVASHRIFASLIAKHGLYYAFPTAFYFSKKHNDAILHYSKENGMLELVTFPLPSSFEELFSEIEKSGDSARRLVENYRTAFPELYANILKMQMPDMPKSLYSLLKIASIVLGMSSDFEGAAEVLIGNAEDFGGLKGPRIDYYLQNKESLNSPFNYLRFIKSAMSFKLAGTDDITLSFGYMESLAYFISDMADTHKENLNASHIAILGSLFSVKRLSDLCVKNLAPNHTICFTKDLPIDN